VLPYASDVGGRVSQCGRGGQFDLGSHGGLQRGHVGRGDAGLGQFPYRPRDGLVPLVLLQFARATVLLGVADVVADEPLRDQFDERRATAFVSGFGEVADRFPDRLQAAAALQETLSVWLARGAQP